MNVRDTLDTLGRWWQDISKRFLEAFQEYRIIKESEERGKQINSLERMVWHLDLSTIKHLTAIATRCYDDPHTAERLLRFLSQEAAKKPHSRPPKLETRLELD